MGFPPGRTVLKRFYALRAVPDTVLCGRVVSDDERGLLLWVAEGSPLRGTVAADGRSIRDMPFREWVAVPKRSRPSAWEGSGILVLTPPGGAHSVWWFWQRGNDGFSGWYVNLEAPSVRWDDGDAAGLDSVDQDLDLVARPDRSWRWKDEQEMAERLAYPEHYWVDDPDAVRAEGERALKLVEAGAFPFDGTWRDFQPDPSWTVPADLPPGWDRPSALTLPVRSRQDRHIS